MLVQVHLYQIKQLPFAVEQTSIQILQPPYLPVYYQMVRPLHGQRPQVIRSELLQEESQEIRRIIFHKYLPIPATLLEL